MAYLSHKEIKIGRFRATRAHASNSFNNLEKSMCDLFEALTGLQQKIAQGIFFKNADRRATLDVIAFLLDESGYKDFRPYFRSFQHAFSDLNRRRNNIVHWNESYKGEISNKGRSERMILVPQNFNITTSSRDSQMNFRDLRVFIVICEYYILKIVRLATIIKQHADDVSSDENWREEFRTPFPPPPVVQAKNVRKSFKTKMKT